jgi:ABC-type lipoprotein release transport system permease subunit
MAVILSWLRLELRRRWRSLAVLALLVAVASGTVMTAAAGARRGASAIDRLQARTLPATTAVLANTAGFDWSGIRALPEVESLTKFVVDYSYAFEGVPGQGLAFPTVDAAVMRTIEKPVVFAGRVFDPSHPDEVVVSRRFVKNFHKGVGDTLVLRLPSPQQLAQGVEDPKGGFSGPRVKVRIVGVVGSLWFSDSPDSPGVVAMSPAIVARYPAYFVGDQKDPENVSFINTLVRLRGGAAALPQFRKDVARVTGRSDIELMDLPAQTKQIQRQLSFEARCLLAFALAAFVASLFLVGQAIVRYAAGSTAELQTLRALGMTPRQAIGTASTGPAIVGVVGALVGIAAAYFASQRFPIGTANLLEPSPGRSVDWVVFGPGLAVVTILVAGGSAGAAWLALGAARRAASTRRSTIAAAVARGGFGVPVVVGTRFALESGRGRTAVPARPAIIGAVIGVLGIVAAFTFSQGVTDAAAHPERFGQTFQLNSYAGFNDQDFGPSDKVLATIAADKNVVGLDDARTSVATSPDGDSSVSLYTYAAGRKPLPVVVTSGRMPSSAREVLLGPHTLTGLHARVGSHVKLKGSRPGAIATYTVTGSGLLPEGPHNGYADGGWVTPSGYARIFTGFKFHMYLVTVAPGHQPKAVAGAIAKKIAKQFPKSQGFTLDPAQTPTEVAEIRQVRLLPIVLGIFLALLAVGAVGHALSTAVRRRSHDLAVLRALGMTQWQCRWVVVTQASVLAVIGLLFGVPVGLALGRTVWRAVADYTPLQYVPPIAAWVLLLVGPAALLIANLLAAWPGQRAARLRISHILRAE